MRSENTRRYLRMSFRVMSVALLIMLFVPLHSLLAQPVKIYPRKLYPGENLLTITAPAGILNVKVTVPASHASVVKVHSASQPAGCPETYELRMTVHTAGIVRLQLETLLCDSTRDTKQLSQNKAWTLDEVPFQDTYVGDTICNTFRISTADPEYLDSVSIHAPNAFLRYSFPPPIRISGGQEYRYQVCFVAEMPGLYRFPVLTWTRRDEPAGGYTNYPVADTGVIRVLPRPGTIKLEEIPFDSSAWGLTVEEEITDPTTFRSVAVPNAIIPPKGRWFVGSYDLLGLTAGYSFSDNVLVFAAGAIPTPDDWGGVNGDMFGAWSLGAKVGTEIFPKFNVAGGYHFGQSTLDKEETADETDSRITVHVPYGAISYGTDDARISLTGGYAFKRHSTWITDDPIIPPFRDNYSRDAAFGALGGDYRFAKHWKIGGEVVGMEDVDVVPVVLSARYFTNTFAIDLGMAWAGFTLNDAEAPPVPLVPIISGIFVF